MASPAGLATAPVRRPRAGDRARSKHLAGRQGRAVTGRRGQARQPAHRRRPAGPGLHPADRPSRHPDPQYRARAAARRPQLHRLRPPDKTPARGLQPHRHRPRACPVTENPDHTIATSDQSLTPIARTNFGLSAKTLATAPLASKDPPYRPAILKVSGQKIGATCMSALRGYVDQADKFSIEGWALDESDTDEVVKVDIVQSSSVLFTIKPNRQSKDVVAALNLKASKSPKHRWRIAFPLACGIEPNIPFSVVYHGTDKALTKGMNLTIPLIGEISADAHQDLKDAIFIRPSYSLTNRALRVDIALEAPIDEDVPLFKDAGSGLFLTETKSISTFNKKVYVGYAVLDPEKDAELSSRVTHVGLPAKRNAEDRSKIQRSLMSIAVPPSVFNPNRRISALPDISNLKRVSGPKASTLTYEVGGATTFIQLDRLSYSFFGLNITEYNRVIDWGCGCGRVTRQFWETAPYAGLKLDSSQEVIGVDIDEVNIDWCRLNLSEHGTYKLLNLNGFDEPDASVDMLYGISVMTHLTESNQQLWMEEIARVIKPGGCVILTTHGEYAAYRSPSNISLPFLERFGFFDLIADPAIGAHRDTYYRATFQTRAHVKNTWSRYFEVLDIFVAANSFIQDFVVLRRRA